MEVSLNVSWSDTLEESLAEIGEKCQGYSSLHKSSEALFSFRKTCIDMPIFLLSTLAGTLSIGSTVIFGENNNYSNVGIGLVSLSVGVLNTISTYFNFATRTETHRMCSIEYSKLYRFISIELSLPRKERMACGDLLKIVKEQYERLQEISPLIPKHIIESFKIRFKDYTNISKPNETNGLQPVRIYRNEKLHSFYDLTTSSAPKYITEEGDTLPGNLRIQIPITHHEDLV